MRRSLVAVTAAVLLAVVAVGSPRVQGTSYNPLTVNECPAEMMAPGAMVVLFHSGTAETQRSIRAGDVLAVFRARIAGGEEAVGTIRVGDAFGKLCFWAAVLDGEVQTHDVARAGSGFCLVLPTDAPCRASCVSPGRSENPDLPRRRR